MSFNFGKNLHIQIFGQSHGDMVGCVIDGLPAGIPVDEEKISAFMSRRSPGKNALATSRNEQDVPRIVSGLYNGCTCGAPLTAIIQNSDVHSGDYDGIKNTPRPSHADYAAFLKYHGYADHRGGGAFSGRLTAPLCFAGAAAKQYLEMNGVTIGAHIYRIADVSDAPFDMLNVSAKQLDVIAAKKLPVIDDAAGEKMAAGIAAAKAAGDSVGGTVECAAVGVPGGLGEPRYDGIESSVAAICFGIPAVKGVEFGLGFGFCSSYGSEVNDEMYADNGKICFRSNNCGGVAGGITDRRPVVFRCAFKPTPSISLKQSTVDLTDRKTAEIEIGGRHDPCVVLRAVPAVESAAALAIADHLLGGPSSL